jgi:3-oxoacid CoA-transferase subunit A/glutaconate CoA-transferase subunit A
MSTIGRGKGELLGWHDPDEQRRWIAENKSREQKDKRETISNAISKFVHDGDFLAMGGFGHDRVSMAAVYEIIRQGRRRLILSGKTAVHDSDLLIAAGCVDKIEVAYAFGHELRGLSPASRRAVESGRVLVAGEISNAALQWRFKAAAMGLPFMPCRVMLGTETFDYSSSMIIEDPFSGKPICLVPACYPDLAILHVHRCDKYGNCQIDGITVEDFELARAARRVIVTTEEIVTEDRIRSEPWRTSIPFFLVDAVIEVPYGCHPGNMPGLYYFDEAHIAEWLTLSRTAEGTESYLRKYVFEAKDFAAYLELVGGAKKLDYLQKLELLGGLRLKEESRGEPN